MKQYAFKPITPKARKFAKENNLDIARINGTGEYGAIRLSDIRRSNAQKSSPVARRAAAFYGIEVNAIPLSCVRKSDVLRAAEDKKAGAEKSRKGLNAAIAAAISNCASFTLFSELDATAFMESYRQIKAWAAEAYNVRVTVSDMYAYLVSRILFSHPKLSAGHHGKAVSIAFAADMPGGPIAPVLQNASESTIVQLARERVRLLEKYRSKTLTNDDLAGASFTLSNLGSKPVTFFTPILNYPQIAILGIGRTEEKPIARSGKILVREMAHFSLTMDHYRVDGMDGADFFSSLQAGLGYSSGFYR
ncbi:MAG: 2-oxo acid dehydrogenase subunit E2 [Eubacteriaceae bacterium]|jgi:pyruvate dehydrogenase E2 component (dihydrolipoamide acetyltransferase)|nr:2-oxo acid dehydrogenase subunit E2 [Eubacteriaceae bacterium]